MHLFAFTVEIYYDRRSYKRHTLYAPLSTFTHFPPITMHGPTNVTSCMHLSLYLHISRPLGCTALQTPHPVRTFPYIYTFPAHYDARFYKCHTLYAPLPTFTHFPPITMHGSTNVTFCMHLTLHLHMSRSLRCTVL